MKALSIFKFCQVSPRMFDAFSFGNLKIRMLNFITLFLAKIIKLWGTDKRKKNEYPVSHKSINGYNMYNIHINVISYIFLEFRKKNTWIFTEDLFQNAVSHVFYFPI